MSQKLTLQQLLGVDKRNPSFTICRNHATKYLHVYYGAELYETVPDEKEHPQYKIMVARLYNAGVNAVKLSEAFGADRKTMRRWGDALKCGDCEKLVKVLEGRQVNRKLTPEIRAFVRIRFPRIYERNMSSYSKEMRTEIEESYGVHLCAETLRPLLKEIRSQIHRAGALESVKREPPCECVSEEDGLDTGETTALQPVGEVPDELKHQCIRKESPVTEEPPGRHIRFVNHIGVLIFSSVLKKIDALTLEAGWLAKQWLATLFLGSVNIEQSKLLDFESLDFILGKTLLSRRPQREKLEALAFTDAADKLLVLNYNQVNASQCRDFYYDPHTKHCTTKDLKLLKSWCGGKHIVAKVLEMDFIHTHEGYPVHIAYGDSYNDLRERFTETINSFRTLQNIDKEQILSVVVDRGIFGLNTFRKIISTSCLNVITWEKNYKRGKWNQKEVQGAFVMTRCRNRAEDIKIYKFEYMDETWEKNSDMRLLRVSATNPKGRTIELGILTNDKGRASEEIIRLMFQRWIQENDFKYLDKHFGINQITSYAYTSYKELEKKVKDKQVKNGEYKAFYKERTLLRQKIKQMLFDEHQHPGKSSNRQEKIKKTFVEDKKLTEKIGEYVQSVSRLELLIKKDYKTLNVAQKRIMDALKLIARNSFYKELRPFKEKYNNYRDDHVYFRNLTHAGGIMISDENMVEVQLFPTAPYTPSLRASIQKTLDDLNACCPCMPDGSDRRITFCLGKKEGIELANVKSLITPNE